MTHPIQGSGEAVYLQFRNLLAIFAHARAHAGWVLHFGV
jgi:hypothetical protein